MGATAIPTIPPLPQQQPIIDSTGVVKIGHYIIVFATYIFLFIDFVMNHGGFVLSCPK